MPDIEFECPNCKHPLVVDDTSAGQLASCPACRADIRVPSGHSQTRPETAHSTDRISLPCPHCSKQLTLASQYVGKTAFCPSCGKAIKVQNARELISLSPPMSAPLSHRTPQHRPATGAEKFPSLNISPAWKARFALIEKAGPFNGLYYRNYSMLTMPERLRVGFNLWGLLFGPFYYFAKGMWSYGVIYFALSMNLSLIPLLMSAFGVVRISAIPVYLGWIIPAWCGAYANTDYYSLKTNRPQIRGIAVLCAVVLLLPWLFRIILCLQGHRRYY